METIKTENKGKAVKKIMKTRADTSPDRQEQEKENEKQKKEIAKAYGKYAKSFTPQPKYVSNSLRAFLTGGALCAAALWVQNILQQRGIAKEDAATMYEAAV